jgi:hypothetical protein
MDFFFMIHPNSHNSLFFNLHAAKPASRFALPRLTQGCNDESCNDPVTAMSFKNEAASFILAFDVP